MSEKLYRIKETDLINIANSIRAKRGNDTKIEVADMSQEILNIETLIPEGYIKPEGTQEITVNGTYDISEYANVNVNVPIPEGYLDPEGTQEITANGGYNVELLEWVNVNVPIPEGYIKPEGNVDITTTNEYDVSNYVAAQIKDNNLIPENIAENVEVLGITGTFHGVVDTRDGTATSDDILLGKTAYVDDKKVTGTIKIYDYSNSENLEPYNSLNEFLKGTKTEITADDLRNMSEIRAYAFQYCPITKITIPNTVTRINDRVFYYCNSLAEITIPNSVAHLGQYCFCYTPITEVTIPSSVTNIGQRCFENCLSLKKVIIENQQLGPLMFQYDKALRTVICTSETPPRIYNSTFQTVSSECIFYVPDASVDIYKATTNWSVYADQIKPLSEYMEG